MKLMKALKPVFKDGKIISAGNVFSCSSDFSRKLVEGKSAELFEDSKPVNVPSSPKRVVKKKG